ncbi:MAG TPA: hypothetical protein VEF06_11065 [Bryobacteraceae bacterium]|nr:hypothetical protein [Bryobacteraceae bacterium]
MRDLTNFRDFHAGPDPFGRKWHVLFKFLQTAISIRHSDSVDVRFILTSGDETMQRTVVMRNADLRAWAAKGSGRKVSDTLCSRVAMLKILQAVETAEDLEKDYLVATPAELEEFGKEIRDWEDAAVQKAKHAA